VKDCIGGASVIVLANPEDEFRRLPQHLNGGTPVVIIDPWRLLKTELQEHPNVEYVGLGLGPQSEEEVVRREPQQATTYQVA